MKMTVKKLISGIALCLIIITLCSSAVYGAEADPSVLDTVQNLCAATSADAVYLSWDAYPYADGYEVYYDSGGGLTRCGATTETWFRQRNLSAATEYTFYVFTYDLVEGEQINSLTASEIKVWTYPVAPSYRITRSGDVFTLKWSAVAGISEGEGYYEILTRTLDTKEWTLIAATAGTKYAVTVKDTDEIFFGVRAVMVKDGVEYRSDFRKKLFSDTPKVGTMAAFGDSIGRGSGAQYYGFPDMIAQLRHYSLNNYSVSGATLSRADDVHSICDDVLQYINGESTFDYILTEGGYNDYALDKPLGEVTPDDTTEFDTSTVCGALETMFTRIKANCPDAMLLFLKVHQVNNTYTRHNALGLTFSDYMDGILAVCEKYGVPVADCSALSTLELDVRAQYTATRFGAYPYGDGIHPNEEGYEAFYLPVLEAFFPELPILGDVDDDGEITILDVTLIQRVLATLERDPDTVAFVTERGKIRYDFLSILDVTYIQRYIAHFHDNLGVGYPYKRTANDQ